MADGPILYWRLDEQSGTTALDASGNGHSGTAHPDTGAINVAQPSPINSDGASTSYAFAPSPSNQCYVASGASTAWDTSSFTAECWVKPSSTGSTKFGLMGIWATDARWYIRCNPTTVEIYLSLTSFSTSATLTLDVWNYLVVTFDGINFRTYVNGSLGSTNAGALYALVTNSPFYVGHNNGTAVGSEELIGGMDEVALYGSALSADRIAVHYNAAF